MIIYRLTTNKVKSSNSMAVISSYVAPREKKKEEFYLDKAQAETIMADRRDAITKLAGFWDNDIEFVIDEISVITGGDE